MTDVNFSDMIKKSKLYVKSIQSEEELNADFINVVKASGCHLLIKEMMINEAYY